MDYLMDYGLKIGLPLITFVAGYVRLQGKVEVLEKEFEEKGRVGKLEKYAGMHFESINGVKETNIRLTEKFETMNQSFKDLHEKIDKHIDEDAKTLVLIQEIHRAVRK